MTKASRASAHFALSAFVGCTFGVALADTSPSSQPNCRNERVSEGCGTYRFPDGTTYVGGFHGGYPDGVHGAITFADGSKLELAPRSEDAVYIDAQGKHLTGQFEPAAPDRAYPHPPIHFPFWRAFFGDTATVIVDAVIDENGNVASAAVDQPTGSSFDNAAIASAKTWRYAPATINGTHVKDIGIITIQFSSSR